LAGGTIVEEELEGYSEADCEIIYYWEDSTEEEIADAGDRIMGVGELKLMWVKVRYVKLT
jgi:hypothetical protein